MNVLVVPGTSLAVLNTGRRIGVIVNVHGNVRRLCVRGRAAVVARVIRLPLRDAQSGDRLRRLLRVHLYASWRAVVDHLCVCVCV